MWTPKAVSEGLNKRQINENEVLNLAYSHPDLLTGVNPATGEPQLYGSVGVDINCAVIGYTATAPLTPGPPQPPGLAVPAQVASNWPPQRTAPAHAADRAHSTSTARGPPRSLGPAGPCEHPAHRCTPIALTDKRTREQLPVSDRRSEPRRTRSARVRAYLGQQRITGHHPGRAGAARIRWGPPAWRTRQTRGRGMTMVRPRLRRYLRRLLLESLSASGGTIAVASAPPWQASMHACRAQRIVGRQRTLQRARR